MTLAEALHQHFENFTSFAFECLGCGEPYEFYALLLCMVHFTPRARHETR